MELLKLYGGKAISNKYVLKFLTKRVYSFKRFNRNRELIPNSWRSHRESTFANIQLSCLETDDVRILEISAKCCRLTKYVGQLGSVGQQHQHAKHYKAMFPSPLWLPVPSGTERAHDQGGCSGQLGLLAVGAGLWVKKSCRNRVSTLQIATYNARTPLKDEYIHKK